MSSRKGTKRNIIEKNPPAQDLRDLGQRERSRARGTDSTSPVLTRQDHSTSSGLQGATARTSGSSSTRRTDTPVDKANAEPDATRAISVRTTCHFARFTPDSDFFSPHILYSTHSTPCLFTTHSCSKHHINYNRRSHLQLSPC